MSKMSEVEKHLISHRKRMENVCEGAVAEVHARALGAEGAFTSLVEHLIDKHGHHDEDNIMLREKCVPCHRSLLVCGAGASACARARFLMVLLLLLVMLLVDIHLLRCCFSPWPCTAAGTSG